MLKCISKLVVDPLVYIYNLSIEQSIFPDTLKIADVKPLFKNGDKSIMSNYRPISMLSNFSKIFEMVQYLTNALRSGSINANTLLRGESLQNEAWLQETFK